LKAPINITALEKRIFNINTTNFDALALEIFEFQYHHNSIYQQFCNLIKKDIAMVKRLADIPFLPIQFFKTHAVKCTNFEATHIFESSGTSNSVASKHYVKDIELYKKSFTNCLNSFYPNLKNVCIIGLLPSYLERNNSSLIMMVDEMIKNSSHPASGFYLTDYEKLNATLLQNEATEQPTLLIGVTYALLDFAEKFKLPLKNTIIMETGGMKGRRAEITRLEVHQQLQQAFSLSNIHSEYGMTELLSQAYSKQRGTFYCPKWMKILIRREDDPLEISPKNRNKILTGAINIIDLANLYSCSFIATDDVGKLNVDDSFEVIGRLDNSDIRGCSQLAL
jgi:Acyl-protein synthetase, LuxE